jgi:hypothetical protein
MASRVKICVPRHSTPQDQAELIDQSRAQKGTVGTAAALQQPPLHAEFAIEE